MHFVRGSGDMGRLLSLGLPGYLANAFLAVVNSWVSHSGLAWTCSRIKSIKTDLIRDRAGLPPLTYLRKNRRGGWYGVWGALLKLSRKSDKYFNIILNVLMYYSAFVPSKPDATHIKKFLLATGAPEVFIPPDFHCQLAAHTRNLDLSVKSFKGRKGITPLIDFAGLTSVRSPIFGSKSVPQNSSLEKELHWFESPCHKGFARCKHWYWYSAVLAGIEKKELEAINPEKGTWYFPYESRDPVPLDQIPYGGRVVPLTKDGGWKVRWIASPYRIHQLALKPFGECLYRLLDQLPWDCTSNQHRAFPYIQEHLRKGHPCFSVDLTSATDYFPLSVQLTVLRSLSSNQDWQMAVDLFSDLSRAKWFSPIGEIQWKKGQPMGLFPSFASFALSHGIVLSLLSTKPSSFFVLGDDVVILDPILYERYLKVLCMLECPHDPHKTLVSSEVAEFAGKVITASSVFPQYKWREVSDDSFLDQMRNFGQRFSQQLRPRQLRVYNRVARLYPPIGCNHSIGPAKGLSEVIAMTELFEKKDGTGRKFDASFLRRLFRLLEPDNPASLFYRLNYQVFRMARHFDEKCHQTFKNTVFSRLPGDRTAVSDILEFVDFPIQIPGCIPDVGIVRKTLLEFMEESDRKSVV